MTRTLIKANPRLIHFSSPPFALYLSSSTHKYTTHNLILYKHILVIFPQLHKTVYDMRVCVYLCSSSETDVIIVCCVLSQGCVENRGEFLGRGCGHHGPYVPDVLFWSVILFFSTVAMSSFLKEFKTSRYFPTKARTKLVCGSV